MRSGSDISVARGTLSEVAGEIDASGTVRLVVTIDEEIDLPPPGSGIDLAVRLQSSDSVLTVAEDAVLVDGGAAAVFVLVPKGSEYKAELRPVRLGARAAGRLEVIEGLREGERVAVGGAELLADGSAAVEADESGEE